MEFIEKVKREMERVIDQLNCMDVNSPNYPVLQERLRTLQEVYNEENERINSNLQLKEAEKRLALENEKLELEQMKMEKEEIQSKKNRRGQWAFEIGKKILGVGCIAAVMLLSVALDNSGVAVPNKFQKFLNIKDIW